VPPFNSHMRLQQDGCSAYRLSFYSSTDHIGPLAAPVVQTLLGTSADHQEAQQ
jgi:hypothetical protein